MEYLQVFINAIVIALMAMYVYENERKMGEMSARHAQTGLTVDMKVSTLEKELDELKILVESKEEIKSMQDLIKDINKLISTKAGKDTLAEIEKQQHMLKVKQAEIEKQQKLGRDKLAEIEKELKDKGLEDVPKMRMLLQEYDQSNHVAFSAHISSGFTAASLGKGHTVVYDISDTNIGNGYDNVTGTFRAPSAGVYAFTWTMCADNQGEIMIELVINGRQRGVNHVDSEMNNDMECTTAFVIEKVNVGHFVFIRSTGAGEGLFMSDGRARWTFSGWKLF